MAKWQRKWHKCKCRSTDVAHTVETWQRNCRRMTEWMRDEWDDWWCDDTPAAPPHFTESERKNPILTFGHWFRGCIVRDYDTCAPKKTKTKTKKECATSTTNVNPGTVIISLARRASRRGEWAHWAHQPTHSIKLKCDSKRSRTQLLMNAMITWKTKNNNKTIRINMQNP